MWREPSDEFDYCMIASLELVVRMRPLRCSLKSLIMSLIVLSDFY